MLYFEPTSPLEEQRRIVACLDGLQGNVDALKALQAELDALLPRAFLYQDRRRQRLKERLDYGW
jgi:hypothetical protein